MLLQDAIASTATVDSTATADSPQAAPSVAGRRQRPFWVDALAPYSRPSMWRSALDLLTSVVPYLGVEVAIYLTLGISFWLTAALSVLAGGFLIRTFIVFHDCAHGSFLATKRANLLLGTALGVLVFAPFERWRHDHAQHHATAGDLDRRGHGDVPTLTLSEYYARDARGRLAYRLYRNPIVMFGFGPIVAMMIGPRIVAKNARPRMRRSVHITNAALAVLVVGGCLLIGWQDFLIVEIPGAMLAGAAGIWLFYVQHQFEDTYWERGGEGGEWSYDEAALRGSSYLRMPKVLQFFTGNIGLHHVHHLSSRIPNYYLQRAHDRTPIFHSVPTITLVDGLRATRLKLWDEDTATLLTFAAARAKMQSRTLAATKSAASSASA